MHIFANELKDAGEVFPSALFLKYTFAYSFSCFRTLVIRILVLYR